MIRVAPMDDELAVGHAGRIAWILGTADQRELAGLLALTLPSRDRQKSVKSSRLSQLAAHAGMSTTDYARKHSMLAALRVAAKPGEDLMHGDELGETFSRRLGMLTQKSGAYICLACVNEDMEDEKSSWYHREHHLFGVDWCPTHEMLLAKVNAKDPWAAMPHHWIESEDIEPESSADYDQQDMVFLRRYAEISKSLLSRAIPLDVRAIRHLIARQAIALGLRTSAKGQRSTISDLVLLKAPAKWLKTHFSHIAGKNKPGFIGKVDGAVISRAIPAQGHVYCLVLASLFDAAEDAIQYLNSSIPAEVVQRVKTPARRSASFWHGEFWDIYVKHDGSTAKIAESLGVDRSYLAERMYALGMPSLHNVAFSGTWRALIRFHDGESLQRACELEKVAVNDVEALQRKSSPQAVRLASKIVKNELTAGKVSAKQNLSPPSGCQPLPAGGKSQTSAQQTDQEFSRFIDTVADDPGSTRQPLREMEAV